VLYRVLRTLLRIVFRLVYRPVVTGREHVPAMGPVVLASNHLSYVDSIVIPVVAPRHVAFLTKSDYFTGTGVKGAFIRWFFTTIGQLPIRRGEHRASRSALETALAVLRSGEAFGIYPEGTRSRDGRLWRGRTGVGWLALEAGCPVVPVALEGTDRVLPVGGGRLRVARVRVSFGESIHPDAYAGLQPARARRQLTDDVMAAIAAMSGQDRSPDYHPLEESP
jgi:1-acyl-sn-glycerol-3-phosphate acyltransferase